MEVSDEQASVCARFGVPCVASPGDLIAGVARNLQPGAYPLNGLRHPPRDGTCGWYLWSGELESRADFFEPLHVAHLGARCAEVLPFLGLAPGWRFLLGEAGYVDVWEDRTLLDVT